MHRIHIPVQIRYDLRFILKIVEVHVIISQQRLRDLRLVIQIYILQAASNGIVPPDHGVRRIEEIEFRFGMLLHHLLQKRQIGLQLLFFCCLRQHLGRLASPHIMRQYAVFRKVLPLRPVIRKALLIVRREGLSNLIRDFLK